MSRIGVWFLMFLLLSLSAGCTRRVDIPPPEPLPAFPSCHGKKIKTDVVEFGISGQALEKYPELREKRVGMGLCNRIVDTFYESGCFELVEEKEKIKKRIMEQWLANAVFDDSMEEPSGLARPEFLIYAEVYDFYVRDAGSVQGVSVRDASETTVTIQVRAVLYANGEYIPASGTGSCFVENKGSVWGKGGEGFDASSIGKASEIALRKAVIELVERLKKKGIFPTN